MLRTPRLWDVKTGNTLLDQVIVIECNKIASVDSTKSLRAIAQAEQIGLPNSTALPGLIGCHTHLTIDPNLFGPPRLHLFNPRFALIGARNARVTLESGFTTVRNLAAQGYTDIGLRDAINAGDVPEPHMLASGPALSITGDWDENYLAPGFAFSPQVRHGMRRPDGSGFLFLTYVPSVGCWRSRSQCPLQQPFRLGVFQ